MPGDYNLFYCAGGGSEETQPLSGLQLSWSTESDLLHQLRLVHRAPPLAQDGLKGTYVFICVHTYPLGLHNYISIITLIQGWFIKMIMGFYTLFTASCGLKMLITLSCPRLSLSDCVPEGELGRPVMLQPGGAACSALLQPGPHAPQSKKQLHVAAQRCSSTDQVSFCTQDSGTRHEKAVFASLLFSLWDVECPSVFLTVLGSYHMA